jgi:hypothetical protein
MTPSRYALGVHTTQTLTPPGDKGYRGMGKPPGYFNRSKRRAERIQCRSRISVGSWCCAMETGSLARANSCQTVTCQQILDQQNSVPLSPRSGHKTIVMPGEASRAPLAPDTSAWSLLPAKAAIGMDLSIAFLVVLALGFAAGYGVRERKSRMRRRRYNLG